VHSNLWDTVQCRTEEITFRVILPTISNAQMLPIVEGRANDIASSDVLLNSIRTYIKPLKMYFPKLRSRYEFWYDTAGEFLMLFIRRYKNLEVNDVIYFV